MTFLGGWPDYLTCLGVGGMGKLGFIGAEVRRERRMVFSASDIQYKIQAHLLFWEKIFQMPLFPVLTQKGLGLGGALGFGLSRGCLTVECNT